MQAMRAMRSRAINASRRIAASTCSTSHACSTSSACSTSRSISKSVREIEHSSIDHAIFSCDQIRLRVQSDLKFGCSISLINKRRSITKLNSDSRPTHFIVKPIRRLASRTLRFCGSVPSLKLPASSTVLPAAPATVSPLSPAFPAAVASATASLRARFAPRAALLPPSRVNRLCAVTPPARRCTPARRTEFISVSGLCPERSALLSDLRLKRISGSAAAPELPHAPMNSPAAFRAGFPSQPSAR